MTTQTPQPTAPAPEPVPGAGGMDAGQWVRLVVVLGLLVALTAYSGVWGLVMVLGIALMIFLHELGHFIMAKRAGMKVTEFFLGFGPRIWSIRRGETEYGLKLIPAGAYVKIIGMHNLEEVDPADEGQTYRQKPFWPRLGVAVAGSTMHFILALVLIYTMLVGFGAPNGQIVPDSDNTAWEVATVTDGSAADTAGLEEGDRLIAVDGTRIVRFEAIRDVIRSRAGESVTLTVERAGERFTRETTIGSTRRDGATVGFLGIGRQAPIEKLGPLEAVPRTAQEFGTISVETFKTLGRLFTPSGVARFGDQVVNARSDRSDPGATADGSSSSAGGSSSGSQQASSEGGEERLMSLLGVFRLGVEGGDQAGASALIFLFIFMNVFIGIFNLSPLLPFDGGHVVVAVYERIQERRRRLQTRYFADITKLLPLTYVVVILLAGIFVSTLYIDIANPVSLD